MLKFIMIFILPIIIWHCKPSEFQGSSDQKGEKKAGQDSAGNNAGDPSPQSNDLTVKISGLPPQDVLCSEAYTSASLKVEIVDSELQKVAEKELKGCDIKPEVTFNDLPDGDYTVNSEFKSPNEELKSSTPIKKDGDTSSVDIVLVPVNTCDLKSDFARIDFPSFPEINACQDKNLLYNFDDEICTDIPREFFDFDAISEEIKTSFGGKLSDDEVLALKQGGFKILGAGRRQGLLVIQAWKPLDAQIEESSCTYNESINVNTTCLVDDENAPTIPVAKVAQDIDQLIEERREDLLKKAQETNQDPTEYKLIVKKTILDQNLAVSCLRNKYETLIVREELFQTQGSP